MKKTILFVIATVLLLSASLITTISCSKTKETVFTQTQESMQGNWELSSFTSTCMSESTKLKKSLTISEDTWAISTTSNGITFGESGYIVKEDGSLKLNLIYTIIQHSATTIEIVCGTDGNTDCEEHYYFDKCK